MYIFNLSLIAILIKLIKYESPDGHEKKYWKELGKLEIETA